MSFISEHHQIKSWSKLALVDDTAESELLTCNVLIRELTKSNERKPLSKSTCNKIERAVRRVKHDYGLEEQETIYIFLKLWYCGFVKKYNFVKAMATTSNVRVGMWKRTYYMKIKYIQEQLIIV